MFQLTQLRLLAVRNCGLRKLARDVQAFGELRRLDISRNRDLEVSDSIPWPAMTALRSLDLSECRHLRVRSLTSFLPVFASWPGPPLSSKGAANACCD